MALLARTGDGCFDIERHRSHHWCWCDGYAAVHLVGWHQAPGSAATVQFNLTGFTPRQVTIKRGAKILWSGAVDRKPVVVRLAIGDLTPEGTDLVFTTDRPSTRENASANARLIAYSIGDLRFSR